MTNTKRSVGRPAVGKGIHIRLDDELLADVDAWAAGHDMSRAESIRHLLATAMRISDADSTLNVLGRLTVESLYPEAGGDAERIYSLISEDASHVHSVELADDLGTHYLEAQEARGHYILIETIGDEYTFTVFTEQAAVTEAYAERVVAITTKLFTPGRGKTMWWDFAGDLELFAGLVRDGRIPAAALLDEGDDDSWIHTS